MLRRLFAFLSLATGLHAATTLSVGTQPSGGTAPLTLPADPGSTPPSLPYLVLRLAPDHPDEKDLSVLKVTETGKVLLSFPNGPYILPHYSYLGYRWQSGYLQPLNRSSSERPPYPYSNPSDPFPGFSYLSDMNDVGVVVGRYSHQDTSDYSWVTSDTRYVSTGCFWPADVSDPQDLPPPYSSLIGGYAADFITDTGSLHGRMLDRGPLSVHQWGSYITYEFGLTWTSISSNPTMQGATWPAGDASTPQIARVTTAVSVNGLHTLGRESYRFFNAWGYWGTSDGRPVLNLLDGLPLSVPHTPVAINDQGRWIATRSVPTAVGTQALMHWSDDRENLIPLSFGYPRAINNAHDILVGGAGGVVWKWQPNPEGSDGSAYRYNKYTIAATPPAGWAFTSDSPATRGFTTSGLFGGKIRRVLDDQGQAIPYNEQTTAPVLIMPVELSSEDRLLKGSLVLPPGWSDVSLSFRATAENGLDLGTFAKLEPEAADSPTYIYASADDIFSEDEQAEAAAGTLDPRANSQAVVFYRDADDPRRLHFATAFDQLGEIEITLAFGPEDRRVSGKTTYTLTAETEAAGLIATFDQRIQSMDIPEVVDFDPDFDGDGLPDGGPADLVAASQPGMMSAPGPFVSEHAEDDPLNLVLLVNTDDDNADGVADHLHPDLDPVDDDLARIVLRAPAGVTSGTLTLTHDGGPALRLRFPTGPPLSSGASVDLAAPAGPLAGLSAGPLVLYAEGLVPAADVAVTLAYTPSGESVPTVSDTVRLTILDPSALADLRTRHRYFVQPGDLGGLLSRAYAPNGAYRQHRLGLAPIGENLPLKNRGLLAKSLFSAIGSLKVTAAYYRGTVDGFWMGLKSDWQGLQDAGTAVGSAIAFFFVEDDAGRMDRAVAIYDKIKEIKEAFAGVKLRELPTMMKEMATTITRDLYTDAEAALGWEPLAPGIDPRVVSYMAGVTTGFVGEQVMMALIPGGAAAKIAPVLRQVVLAVKNGTRYSLEAVSTLAKATAKLGRGVQTVARSQDEVKAALHATQKVKNIEFPGGLRAPQVIDDWFKLKPQLKDDVLNIWADKLPATLTDQRLTHMMNDLATVLHRFGNNPPLSDDAVKGFAHLQARLFRAGEDKLSRWKDMEKLFDGLSTPAKRSAMQASLVAYKQAAELNPAAKFWIKNISEISPDAYRYSSYSPPNGWETYSGTFPDLGEPWYCSFNKIDTPQLANDRLLLPGSSRNPRYRFEFETIEVENKARVPLGQKEIEPHFEPLTRDPPLGANAFVPAGTGQNGGASQFLVEGDFAVKRVVDMETGQQVWP